MANPRSLPHPLGMNGSHFRGYETERKEQKKQREGDVLCEGQGRRTGRVGSSPSLWPLGHSRAATGDLGGRSPLPKGSWGCRRWGPNAPTSLSERHKEGPPADGRVSGWRALGFRIGGCSDPEVGGLIPPPNWAASREKSQPGREETSPSSLCPQNPWPAWTSLCSAFLSGLKKGISLKDTRKFPTSNTYLNTCLLYTSPSPRD